MTHEKIRNILALVSGTIAFFSSLALTTLFDFVSSDILKISFVLFSIMIGVIVGFKIARLSSKENFTTTHKTFFICTLIFIAISLFKDFLINEYNEIYDIFTIGLIGAIAKPCIDRKNGEYVEPIFGYKFIDNFIMLLAIAVCFSLLIGYLWLGYEIYDFVKYESDSSFFALAVTFGYIMASWMIVGLAIERM